MRLTLVLRKQHLGRMIRRHWRVQGEREVREIPLSPSLIEKGVNVYDPILEKEEKRQKLHLELEKKQDEYIGQKWPKVRWLKPEPLPLHRRFDLPEPYAGDMTLRKDLKNPLWKDKAVYHVTKETCMLQGPEQALVLTKAVKYEGLPDQIMSLPDKFNLSSQDDLVMHPIKLALLWDSIQEKLPKLYPETPEKPPDVRTWTLRRYGIPQARKVANLFGQMTNACEKIAGYLSGALERSRLEPTSCRTTFVRDGKTLLFDLDAELLLTSKNPLAPFSTLQETNETINQSVPDIHPVTYTLNVQQSNIYRTEEKPAISSQAVNVYPHTICLGHSDVPFWDQAFVGQRDTPVWDQSNYVARAIFVSFGFAAAQARQKYGMDVKDLPEPLCIQCIFTDAKYFGFLAYQLNTLDIESETGKKNQVWIDNSYELYKECNQTVGVLGYNTKVFDRFLSFYLNGLRL